MFTTVYEQDSFVPVARVVWLQPHLAKNAVSEKDKSWLSYFNEQVNYREQYYRNNPLERENFERKAYLEGFAEIKIYHYHVNHLGTPQELSNQEGDIVWLSYDRAWGGQFYCFYKSQTVGNYEVTQEILQPIKFQGQFFDKETSLHYNRFRYYDSDVGMFISRDPIGLLGGSNVFQYAPNPVEWIDPWGLIKCSATGHDFDRASQLPIIKKGSQEWKNAIETIKNEKSSNFRVSSKDEAYELLKSAKKDIPEYETYIEMSPKYKKGFEYHPNESNTVNAPHNDLPHIKWVDWSQGKSKGGKGHIFYDE